VKKLVIDIPQLPFWLLRLAAQPVVQARMVLNPVLFAAWYAPLANIVSWPETVTAIQSAERKRKLSLERMSSLLSKVNYAVEGGSRDVDYVRRVLEGVAVHEWVSANQQDFADVLDATLGDLEDVYDYFMKNNRGRFTANVHELSEMLALPPLARDVLTFAFACAVSEEMRTLFGQLERSTTPLPAEVFSQMLKTTPSELRGVVGPESSLTLSGLLSSEGRVNRYPVVSDFWVRTLTEATEGVAAALTEPVKFRPTSGVPARLPVEDLTLAASILRNGSGQPGVNLLLYGAAGMDKQEVLRAIIAASGKDAYRLARHEKSYGETAALAYIAQRALAKSRPDALLVIERPAEVLEAQLSPMLKKLFGLDFDISDVAPFDEMVLTTNPAPTVWLAGSTAALNPDTVARFVFHARLQKARREDRRAQLLALVEDMGLSEEAQAALLRLEDTSAVQLEAAWRAVALSGESDQNAKESALVQAVKRSLAAMERAVAPKSKESVTAYSLDFVNCSGRFRPEQVLQSLQKRQKGTVCLYGIPGTGKTQFVEKIAEVLGKPLIAKRASDLLTKWVGETEQNIAAMFEEAASEAAVLFLDEGDSFLRNRDKAEASWEVTRVNELLQHMERFDGIFIVATNLFKGLDTAALRRFTFKLEFLPLKAEQRWQMFVNEAGLNVADETVIAKKEAWMDQLVFMRNLCAGDFATVKQQCILLDVTLSPEDWLESLAIECRVKAGDADPGLAGN
jgi:DNA replication protein DnaC